MKSLRHPRLGMTKRAGRPGQANIRHELSWVNKNAGYWVTELRLFIHSQFLLRLNCYEMLWLDLYKNQLQANPFSFYSNISRELFIIGIQYIYIEYICSWVWLAFVYVKNWHLDPRDKYSLPFLIFLGDHLRSDLGIISSLGNICGAVQYPLQSYSTIILISGQPTRDYKIC